LELKEEYMDEKAFARIRDWVEPAHPAVVKQFEDLVSIYKVIREKFQGRIDQAFDRASREIGFVVTTTLPVTVEIPKRGEAVKWTVSEPLKGSLFEKAILEAVAGPSPDPWKAVSPGAYKLYLVWHDALKLKLRKDWLEPAHVGRHWLEPAHFLRPDILERIPEAVRVRPEVLEPAHWFHPRLTIPVEDQILISVIDEVYPELRLAERVFLTRELLRKLRPEVMEPAHFRPMERDILAEIESVLRKYGV
jgi:hypothetical protein